MANNPRSRSSELTGGDGFTYEDTVAACYLAALLREEPAPGTRGTVVRVAVQQKALGDPLDDLIVDSDEAGVRTRLSLQVKKQVTVSSSNGDFTEIIAEAVATRAKPEFKVGKDRYGFIVRSISISGLENLDRIIGFASASTNGQEFVRRFAPQAEANASMIAMRDDVRSMIGPADDNAEWDFYRHFIAYRLDNLRDGEERFVELSNRLNAVAEAPGSNIVSVVCQEVRRGESKAKVWTRNSLIADLRTKVSLRVAPTYDRDLNALSDIARNYVEEIRADIGGTTLDRDGLIEAAESAASKYIYSNINGAPGCGKSVILRRCVERALARGPVLFLKSDRLQGANWRSFANSQGLQHLHAADLLGEIGGAGTPTIFIDGIDRVKAEHRAIITDLLTAIRSTPDLAHWHVLVTSRDQGLEPLRSWIPSSLYASTGIGDVAVDALNDDEAEVLADKHAELRPLLFGAAAVQEIARRPFFAAVLAEQASRLGFGDQPPPQTETELIDAWWRAGGYDIEEVAADQRQHALLNLAEVGAPTLGKGIAGRNLTSETRTQLEALRRDKLIDVVVSGSRYQFSHDIFFEWSFFRLLIDQGADWPAALVAAGEPPLLARIVGLLSQSAYEHREDWEGTYRDLQGRTLRPQWRRAWLLGPASSTRFAEHITDLQKLLNENDFELLEKFLVWFQAERTLPSPLVLKNPQSDIANAMIVRVADLMGWPSGVPEWQRVLIWLFAIQESIPGRLVPAVVELFGVWQNMCADFPNSMSRHIVERSLAWLLDLEDGKSNRWDGLRDDAKAVLADTLRKLILRAARSYPAPAEALLDRIIAQSKRADGVLKAVFGLSPVLSQVFPEKLAALLKAELIKELPKDERDRKRAEDQARRDRLRSLREKPESERTEAEERALANPSIFFSLGEDRYDFDHIGIGRQHSFFYPAAVGHEPFDSLFQFAPDTARALVRDIANHATTGWRQIFEIDPRRHGTPIPINVTFPWGAQQFWGNGRSYAWYYGEGCPQPLAAAFLALTHWAHKRREAGDDLETLIRQVVEGHTSVAVLGLAISLAIEGAERTPSLLAMMKVHRLWHMDFQRQVQEAGRGIAFMGIDPTYGMNPKHKAGHVYLMGLKYREHSLKDLSFLYALSTDEAEREDFAAALTQFASELPFEIEEHRGDVDAQKYFLERAEAWARFGQKDHYGVRKSNEQPGMIEVAYQDPTPPTEEAQRRSEEAATYLRESHIAMLAIKSFEANQPDERVNLAAFIGFAKSRDSTSLFDVLAEAGTTMTQSCVSAVAALVIRFGGAEGETDWAWSVLDRVAKMKPGPNENIHSHYNLDPRVFLMIALRADIVTGSPKATSVPWLFDLSVAANSNIAQSALAALLSTTTVPDVAWNAAALATELFAYPVRDYDELDGGRARVAKRQARHVSQALKQAVTRLKKGAQGSAQLNPPPPAWELRTRKRRVPGSSRSVSEEVWGFPSIAFNPQYAAKLLRYFPIEEWLQTPTRRDQAITYIRELVRWTGDRLYPSFRDEDGNDSANLYEWTEALARFVARVILALPLDEALLAFVDPIAGRGGGRRDRQYLSTLTDSITRRYVYDATEIPAGTLKMLDAMMTRMLAERDFSPTSYRAGEINDRELREMIETFLLTSATDCPGAARFANGDWSDLGQLFPQIERLMAAVGWADAVMDQFLTLVSRAAAVFPISTFSRIVLAVLDSGHVRLERWNQAGLPATISGAIQALADANQPLSIPDARGLLLILDRLVDLGDRTPPVKAAFRSPGCAGSLRC